MTFMQCENGYDAEVNRTARLKGQEKVSKDFGIGPRVIYTGR